METYFYLVVMVASSSWHAKFSFS